MEPTPKPTIKPTLKTIKIRKKPIEVEAIKWSFDTCDRYDLFDFGILDEHILLSKFDNFGKPSLRIWNILEQCWVNVPDGHWIIKGIGGEFYPHCPKLFPQVYDIIPEGKDATSTESKDGAEKLGLSPAWVGIATEEIDMYKEHRDGRAIIYHTSIETAKEFLKNIAPYISRFPLITHKDKDVAFYWKDLGENTRDVDICVMCDGNKIHMHSTYTDVFHRRLLMYDEPNSVKTAKKIASYINRM
jgi:hypothetical protein